MGGTTPGHASALGLPLHRGRAALLPNPCLVGRFATVALAQFWLIAAGRYTATDASQIFSCIGTGSSLGAILAERQRWFEVHSEQEVKGGEAGGLGP